MKIIAIALKDLKQGFRSLFAVGMMFGAPLLITGLIYFAFSGLSSGKAGSDLPTLKVAVVNLDQPANGQQNYGALVITFLEDSRMPGWLKISQLADEKTARAEIDRQEIGAAVIVPVDFSRSILSSNSATSITIVQDPTLTIGPIVLKDLLTQLTDGINGGKIAVLISSNRLAASGVKVDKSIQQSIFQSYSAWYSALSTNIHHGSEPELIVRPVQVESSTPTSGAGTNPTVKVMTQIMAGMLIFFAFFTGAYASESILREDEGGTLARLFSSPTQRSTILTGKLLAVFSIVFVQSVVLMALATIAFRVNWGQPLSAGLVMLGQVAAASGFGILLISLVKNSRQAGAVVGGVISGTGLLGGLLSASVPNMPGFVNIISYFTPQGWVMDGWKAALAGSPVDQIAPTFIVLLCIGIALFGAGSLIFRRRFA
ncbi:MAG: ABC transporter permease [Anaerolineaceae bacterium]|nr:ABC transporter permease [Anaerolineaceae bacterium]